MQYPWHRLAVQLCGLILLILQLLGSCAVSGQPQVVIYTSVDQHYAEPVLDDFERTTGIRVMALYDVEAAKTTGLANRLLAESAHPRADVFWNSEFTQTLYLKSKGVLAPFRPDVAEDLPAQHCDPEHFWHGTAPRARVLIINTEHVAPADYPVGMDDFLDETWPAEKIAMAMPMFGTTNTHATALYASWGPEAALAFFRSVKERGVRIEAGNSVVRDRVAEGDAWWGLTDTDDAAAAIERGAPVAVVFPDQQAGGIGTLTIPSTVAVVQGAPHPDEARLLVEYLLSVDTEQRLVDSGWCHFPRRAVLESANMPEVKDAESMTVSLEDMYKLLEQTRKELQMVFVQ